MKKILTAEDSRKMTKKAVYVDEADLLVVDAMSDIAYNAKCGKSFVIMTSDNWTKPNKPQVLSLALEHLRENGYRCEEYSGTETEYGCFGASQVAVIGWKIEW